MGAGLKIGVAVVMLAVAGGAVAVMKRPAPESPVAAPVAVAPAPVVEETYKAVEAAPVPVVRMSSATAVAPVAATVEKTEAAETGGLAGTLKLASPGMIPNEKMSLYYTCYGKNVSPALSWSGAPEGTKSFAVTFEQAETAGLLWGVYNIPATMTALPEGLPSGATLEDGMAQALNKDGNPGYAGPCIPKGEFMFVVTIYALDIDAPIPPGVERGDLMKAMEGHIVDKARLSVSHYYRL